MAKEKTEKSPKPLPSYYKEVAKNVCKPTDFAVVRNGNVYLVDTTSAEYVKVSAERKAKKIANREKRKNAIATRAANKAKREGEKNLRTQKNITKMAEKEAKLANELAETRAAKAKLSV